MQINSNLHRWLNDVEPYLLDGLRIITEAHLRISSDIFYISIINIRNIYNSIRILKGFIKRYMRENSNTRKNMLINLSRELGLKKYLGI